jgi:hypothetical protein
VRARFERRLGVSTTTVTIWSPVPTWRSRGMPLPRRRTSVPLCVPGAMSISSGPSSVGTSKQLPMAAWA